MIGLGALITPAFGQKEDSIFFTAEEEALLAELEAMDSLSFFSLIDSLLLMDGVTSTWNARLNYNGQVLTAGRDLGANQYGFSPGLSYYHKSGAYADISTYWNSEFEPRLHLTVFTLGYLGLLGNNFSYSLNYDHSLFHGTASSLTNTLASNITFNKKHWIASLDYAYMFGESSAHRITPSLSGYFKISKPKSWIDKIVIMPSAAILLGNQEIVNIRFSEERQVRTARLLSRVSNERLSRMVQRGIITQQQAMAIRVLRNQDNLNLSPEQYDAIYDFLYTEEVSDAFGIMNYYFTLPIIFYHKDFNFSLSYTYNIPVALPGENLDLENTGYLSMGISYTFGK